MIIDNKNQYYDKLESENLIVFLINELIKYKSNNYSSNNFKENRIIVSEILNNELKIIKKLEEKDLTYENLFSGKLE